MGISLSTFLAFYLYKKFKKGSKIPKEWRKVGKLVEISYFPLRSCSGIELDEGFCGEFGLGEGNFHDRIFQLVDIKSGEIGFAGKRPKLYEIKTQKIDDNILKVSAHGMEDLIIDVHEIAKGKEYYHDVYGFVVPLLDCGEKFDIWFSRFLLGKDTGLKLSMSRTPVVKTNWFRRTPVCIYFHFYYNFGSYLLGLFVKIILKFFKILELPSIQCLFNLL